MCVPMNAFNMCYLLVISQKGRGKKTFLFACFVYIVYIRPMKRFTTSYYDDYNYESEYGKQPEGFDSVEDAVKWNEDRNIPIYIVSMTEWDLEETDFQDIPEILQQGNLESWKYNYLTPMI